MNRITPERWNQIDALFAEALEMAPEDRGAFLEQACGGDADLCRQVHALLSSDLQSERLFGESVTEYVAPLMPDFQAHVSADRDERPADGRIGPYQVLHEIGRGGMGTVFMAERDDEHFRKRVALKLVKRGMDSDEILRRFRYERQILASLEHPNIARLYDGGVTSDGRPYLVMEYVGGRTIDRYCDDEALTVDERLELFGSVCDAVGYAHRSLVVHRDLKPGNILVTEDGTVKLLDFGIAKLLGNADGSSETMATRTGLVAMTPEYASPEQLRGEPVTTASDAYSLGIILYELLTGHRPFDRRENLVATLGPTRDTHEPEPPSSVVTRVGSRRRRDGTTESVTPERVSAARRTSTDRLRRRLRGDLDTILLTALQPEPERRYPSAEAFVEDVKRHLAGLPVHARKDTTGYRALKFVRRHRFGVAAATVFVLLLATSASALLVQQARTARERDRAQMEAEKATEIAGFVLDLFQRTDPNEAAGDTLTALELLDLGADRVGVELSDRPEVQASILHVLGTLYLERAAYARADSLLQRAVRLRRAIHPGPHSETIESLDMLAAVRGRTGAFSDADSLILEALELITALPEPNPLLLATLEHHRAVFLLGLGRFDEAEPLYRSALETRQEALGDDHETFAESLEGMGDLFQARGTPSDAEPLFRRALAIRERIHGSVHTHVADVLNKLAGVHHATERYDEAEAMWRRALDIRRTLLGNDHPVVGVAMLHLALPLMDTGRLEEAEPLQRAALSIFDRSFGPDHSTTIGTRNNLAFVIDRQGRSGEAEAMYREVVAAAERVFGPDHPQVASGLQNVAVLRQRVGDLEEAEALYRRAVTIREQRLGSESTYTATTRHSYALLLLERGDCVTAEPLFRQALVVFEKEYEAGHSRIAFSQGGLGACLTLLDKHQEAEPLLQSSFLALRAARGVEDAGTQQAVRRLASLYAAWGKPEPAAEYLAMLSAATD